MPGMKIQELGLGGMLLLSREPHADERGTFEVVWNGAELAAAGIEVEFLKNMVGFMEERMGGRA
jgi:hypothetical protein